jgi:hypothetical protein
LEIHSKRFLRAHPVRTPLWWAIRVKSHLLKEGFESLRLSFISFALHWAPFASDFYFLLSVVLQLFSLSFDLYSYFVQCLLAILLLPPYFKMLIRLLLRHCFHFMI